MDGEALSSLLWLLVIGGLFYYLMRMGGCGGHGHGGHGGGAGGPEGGSGRPEDPVCGMEVEETGAAGSREHAGRTFYFCSEKCMEKFDRDPAAYVGS